MKGPFAKMSMGTLVSLVLITVTGVFLLGACLIVAIHRIQEGHVGVYFRNGRLIQDVSGPGKIRRSRLMPKNDWYLDQKAYYLSNNTSVMFNRHSLASAICY